MVTWRKAKQDGDAWNPAPGEVLTGELIGERAVETKNGQRSMADIKTDTGKVSVWLTSQVLTRQWEELNPQPGDLVRITYEGKRQGKNYYEGKLAEYHAYVLEVAEPEPSEISKQNKTDLNAADAAYVEALDFGEEPPPHGEEDEPF